MKKWILVIGMVLAFAGQWIVDYAKTEISRELVPPSPAAAKLLKSLTEDADWQRTAEGTLANERLRLVVVPASVLNFNKSAVVRRLGSDAAVPGFSGDDLKQVGRAFPDAYQLAGERELARHLAPLDKATPKDTATVSTK